MKAPPAATPEASAAPALWGPRRARAALLALLAVAALLRVWYLPNSERTAVETPVLRTVEAALGGEETAARPVSRLAWYPQYALLRLADGIHDRDGGDLWRVVTAGGRVTQRGLWLARLASVAWGVTALALLFLVGRRLHSPAVGLAAALILAFSPWHIQASVSCGPDVLVLALSLLSLWSAMAALDRPTAGRYALVGAALGAAAAAKVTGLLIAPPVIAGLLWSARRDPRRALLLAGVTLPAGLAVCWALTPPWGGYLAELEAEQARQARRAARELGSRFTVAVLALIHPLRESVHGRLLGSLALLGAAGQAFRCLFLLDPGPARTHRLMAVAAAPVFALGYAWATPLYREFSFVPLVGYSSLYAAVMLAILWRALVDLAPRLRGTAGAGAAAALVLVLAVPAGWRYVHSRSAQSTLGVAVDWLRGEFGEVGPRVVLFERSALAGSPITAMQLAQGVGLSGVERLAGLDAERLARADAEVFLRRELAGPDAGLYEERRRAGRQRLVEAKLLRRRGPDLVAVVHPRGTGPPERRELAVEISGTWRQALLAPAAEGVTGLSLLLRLPATPETAPQAPRAWLDGRELRLAAGGLFPRETLFVTERLPPSPRPRRLVIEPPAWMAARRGEVAVASFAWR